MKVLGSKGQTGLKGLIEETSIVNPRLASAMKEKEGTRFFVTGLKGCHFLALNEN